MIFRDLGTGEGDEEIKGKDENIRVDSKRRRHGKEDL